MALLLPNARELGEDLARHASNTREMRFIKRLLFGNRPRLFTILFGIGRGLRIYTDPTWNSQRIIGLAEAEVAGDFRRLAGRCGRYVELGASDGYYCAVVRRENPAASIVAFEPMEHYAAVARSNLEANELSLDRFDWRTELGGTAASPLSELIHGDEPTFIKIDIDGGEVEALVSAGDKLASYRGGMLIEVHSPQLKADCLSLLRVNGFLCRTVRQAAWRRIIPERRPLLLNEWIVATKG